MPRDLRHALFVLAVIVPGGAVATLLTSQDSRDERPPSRLVFGAPSHAAAARQLSDRVRVNPLRLGLQTLPVARGRGLIAIFRRP